MTFIHEINGHRINLKYLASITPNPFECVTRALVFRLHMCGTDLFSPNPHNIDLYFMPTEDEYTSESGSGCYTFKNIDGSESVATFTGIGDYSNSVFYNRVRPLMEALHRDWELIQQQTK